ncbi:MAG: response regulator transcription factor, partial [Lachnospiraceae bacterium]|nr:response regulator transcription factor [Lachnospiraceae bacterium]
MQHKILIAEDDTDINRLLSRILEAQGYQALQAFSGTEALSLIEAPRCPHPQETPRREAPRGSGAGRYPQSASQPPP